jgi:glutathione S-transferase
MITLYYARPSLFARPVWLALLEKGLDFELVYQPLDGSQFEPEFSQLTPFNRIPVLVDQGLRVLESQAILDYLEARYPTPSLLPTEPAIRATVRMVQMVGVNELIPAIAGLMIPTNDPLDQDYARHRAITVLEFYSQLLGHQTYFCGEQLSLAEIVAGTLVPILPRLGLSLAPYPALQNWMQRLLTRPTWQEIQLSDQEFADIQRRLRVYSKVWQRRRRQRVQNWSQQGTGVDSGMAGSTAGVSLNDQSE